MSALRAPTSLAGTLTDHCEPLTVPVKVFNNAPVTLLKKLIVTV